MDTTLINNSIQYFVKLSLLNGDTNWLDLIFKIATILIAIVNVIFVIYIYIRRDKKENTQKEQDRKLLLFKTMLLDSKMSVFFEYFDRMQNIMSELKTANLKMAQRNIINNNQLNESKQFRVIFIDLFLAFDKSLYIEILTKVDEMSDNLTENIIDEGLNFSCSRKYEEVIEKNVSETRTNILKIIYSFNSQS